MAVFKIFPEKDTTIYTEYNTKNTGRDEILEVASYYGGGLEQVARSLIQFNSTEVGNVLNTYVSSSTRAATDFSASLRLFLASGNELPDSYTLETWPVYVGSGMTWKRGTGKYSDSPHVTDGASWIFSQRSGSGVWGTTTYVTQSYSGSVPAGGSWYTGSATRDFNSEQTHTVISTHDTSIDISEGMKAHYNGEIPNAGFIVKFTGSLEFQSDDYMVLRYFSSNTNTIYPPHVELKWDDYVSGSSLTEVSDTDLVVKIRNNRGKYADDGLQRFKLHVRPKYAPRTFATSSAQLTNYYLPEESYWGLRDENTEEMVIDFDTTYTKLSRGTDANYFDIHMGGLQPERYYRVLLKTTIAGSTIITDENLVFKVIRNV
jgi:hypothetical protein